MRLVSGGLDTFKNRTIILPKMKQNNSPELRNLLFEYMFYTNVPKQCKQKTIIMSYAFPMMFVWCFGFHVLEQYIRNNCEMISNISQSLVCMCAWSCIKHLEPRWSNLLGFVRSASSGKIIGQSEENHREQ